MVPVRNKPRILQKEPKQPKRCICHHPDCQAEVEGGQWLAHVLPNSELDRLRAWLRVLCPKLSGDNLYDWVDNPIQSRGVHTSHFANRYKTWVGFPGPKPILGLMKGAMPKKGKKSKVPSYAGEPLTEEVFTLDAGLSARGGHSVSVLMSSGTL
jgi:hypothetical protein